MIRAEKERAQLRIAGQVVGQKQRRNFAVNIQFLRRADGQPDAKVVPRLTQAHGAGNGRNTDHLAVVVFQHKQIVGIAAFGFTAKGFLGPGHAVQQAFFIGGQRGQTGSRAAGQFDQGR